VAGESLRQRLERQTQLSIEEAIEITRQVAAALDYAHGQGVVHRDIKPENILLQEGEAVVADFGIARALRVAGGERLTETGLSLGTPHYMSPEQASGNQDLDSRSDVYSLACVLYEMLAGDPPFTGPTASAIIARQLVDPVPSLRTVRPTVPEELERAIEKALAKVPADRYDTAGAFVEAAGAAAQVEVVPTRERRTPRRRVSPRAWRVGAAVAALLIVVAVVLFRMMASSPITITTSNIRAVTTDPGLEFQPAISSDGREVAYVVGPIGTPRIVVRSTIDVGTGGGVRVADGVAGGHWYPAWTPDGASLRFLARTLGSCCDWKEVGKLGGSVQAVFVPRVSSRYAWSWDGTRVAFAAGEDSIFAYSADNGEPELLGLHVVTPFGPHSLAWSPDGRLIAYVNGNPWWRTSANVMGASIWILDANGGEPVRVTDEGHMNVYPQWLPDSRHLLFVSDRDGARGIYVVEVGPEGPRGPPRSVPGSSDPHSISISADGRRLAYSKFTVKQNIWSVPIPRSGSVSISDAVPVTEGNQVIEQHALSSDGEWIVFDSNIRGEFDIYKQPLEGGRQQLVADITGDAFAPDWSPDGAEIALYSWRIGSMSEVLVVSADGGTLEQLTDNPGIDSWPDWSPDGLAIAFSSQGPHGVGTRKIWILSRDGVGMPWSDPVQLTDFGCWLPDWAPDGASLVCDAAGDEFARVSRHGDVLSRYDPSTAGLHTPEFPHFQFSPDGSRIYFLGTHEDGSEGVWWIPANGGDATKVVAFDDPSLSVPGGFTVGPENLYITISEYESDIWVMDLEW
jgi:Tol biopolymer transport system component